MEGLGVRRGNGSSRQWKQLPGGGLSSTALLAFGLNHVGFGEDRQKYSKDLSTKRFWVYFFVSPKSVKVLISLLKQYSPDVEIDLRSLLVAMCWLKLYETEPVMTGR